MIEQPITEEETTFFRVEFPSPEYNGSYVVEAYAIDNKDETTLNARKLLATDSSDIAIVVMPLWYWKKIVRYAIDTQGLAE